MTHAMMGWSGPSGTWVGLVMLMLCDMVLKANKTELIDLLYQ